jgi:two-component system, NarL family, sensor kinase
LEIEVVDDGRGFASPRADGVGLGSMRERATELGGSFSVESGEERGTAVRATLPLRF